MVHVNGKVVKFNQEAIRSRTTATKMTGSSSSNDKNDLGSTDSSLVSSGQSSSVDGGKEGKRKEEGAKVPARVTTAIETTETSSSESRKNPSEEDVVSIVGPFLEGSSIVIECSASGGKPIPDIKWMNGSIPLRSKIIRNNNPPLNLPFVDSSSSSTMIDPSNSDLLKSSTTAVASVRFPITRHDLGSVFSCSVGNNATGDKPLTRLIAFDVHGSFFPLLSLFFVSFFPSSFV